MTMPSLVLPILVLLALAALGLPEPARASPRSEAKTQVEFGIAVAQRELWREATARWERAVDLDPSYAAGWNNLAIAYEQTGRFDEARRAFEKALSLAPGHQHIRMNYDLFREMYERTTGLARQ
jgi:Tfp pilus assembly protein PilF